MRRSHVWVLAWLLAGGAVSCSSSPRTSVTILLSSDVLSLDPNKDVETVTDSVLFNVYEALVGFDDNLEIRPVLAESWEHPEPERWRFHLRKGVSFQDGTPLTAAIVRDALLALHKETQLEASDFLGQVRGISVAGQHAVDIETAEPRALLASLPFLYITKPNAAGSFPPQVGTGPYRIGEWTPGQRVVLERWDGYRGPAPSFRTAVFAPVRDPRARVARLRDGSADIVYGVPHDLAVQGGSGVRFVRHPGLTVFYLGFDLRDRPGNAFRDPRVRRALHLAIDRRAMVDRVLLGRGTVPTQPVASLVFGYNPDLPAPRPDVPRARRLLAEAGYQEGFKARLDFSSSRLPEVRFLQQALREVRVEIEPNPLEKDVLFDRVKAGQSELFLLGWGCGTGEASEFYEFSLHTPTSRYGRGNYGAYSNPEVDRIAETNATILDPRERRALLQKAAAIVMEDLPLLPLFVEDDIYGVREHVRFRPRADGEVRVSDVDLETR